MPMKNKSTTTYGMCPDAQIMPSQIERSHRLETGRKGKTSAADRQRTNSSLHVADKLISTPHAHSPPQTLALAQVWAVWSKPLETSFVARRQ
ncbi:hypothetical protein LSAT2_012697 [Lamellibrachia satsuma]|nr:hypothetical protein LSAT2_012697 [Lamellibrachia satsuma]